MIASTYMIEIFITVIMQYFIIDNIYYLSIED